MKRLALILALLLSVAAHAQQVYRIRMPASTYSAKLSGASGRTSGLEVTGVYNALKDVHEFDVTATGVYHLYYDATGGTSWVKDSNWGGDDGKLIIGSDWAAAIENTNSSFQFLSAALADDCLSSDHFPAEVVPEGALADSCLDRAAAIKTGIVPYRSLDSDTKTRILGTVRSGTYDPDGTSLQYVIIPGSPPDTLIGIATEGVLGTHLSASAKDTTKAIMDRYNSKPTISAAYPAQAYNFDGSNDYVSFGTSTQLDLGLYNGTFLTFINNRGNSGSTNTIFDVYDGTTTDRQYMAVNTTGYLLGQIIEGGTAKLVTASCCMVADSSNHVAAFSIDRYSATGLKLYVDGQEVDSYVSQQDPTSLTGAIASTGQKRIGLAYNNAGAFKGTISRFVFANVALPSDVVFSLSSGGTVPYRYSNATQTPTYNSDFSAGVDSWAAINGAAAGNIDGIGGQNDCLRFTVAAGSAGHYLYQSTPTTVIGKLYRITFDYYIPSGQSNIDGIWLLNSNGSVNIGAVESTTDAWTSVYYEYEFATTAHVRLYATDGGVTTFDDAGADDVFYIRNYKITRGGVVVDARPSTVTTMYDQGINAVEGTVSGAVFTGQQGGLFSTVQNPDSNQPLVQAQKTVSGTTSTVFEVQAEGDATLSGSTSAVGLTIESTTDGATGPDVTIYTNSASPTLYDEIGRLGFHGQGSAATEVAYSAISTTIMSPTFGNESAMLDIGVMSGGGASPGSAIRVDGSVPIIQFNAGGADYDFKVTGFGYTNNLTIDGTTGDWGSQMTPTHDIDLTRGAATSYLTVGTGWTHSSDRGLKTNIRPAPDLLSRLDKFAGVDLWQYDRDELIVPFDEASFRDGLTDGAIKQSVADHEKYGREMKVRTDKKIVTRAKMKLMPDSTMVPVGIDTVGTVDVPVYEFVWRQSAIDSLREAAVSNARKAWDDNQAREADEKSGKDILGPMAQEFYGAFWDDSTRTEISDRDIMMGNLVMVQQLYGRLKAAENEIDALWATLAAVIAATGVGVAINRKKKT